MKVLLFILFCLIVIALTVMGIQKDPGTILIHLSHTQIQTSLWTAAIIAFLAFVCFYIIVRIIIRTLHLGEYFRARRRMTRAREARRLSDEGLLNLINGQFSAAGANFERAMQFSKKKLLPGILQATSVHFSGDTAMRDSLFNTIQTKDKKEQLTVSLARTALLVEAADWERVLTQLKSLRVQTPHHPHINRSLATAAEHLQEWPVLIDLLPALKKAKNVTPPELRRWTECCAMHQLSVAAHQAGEALPDTWKGLSRELRHHVTLQNTYIQALMQQKKWGEALAQLKSFMKKSAEASFYILMQQFPNNHLDELILFLDKYMQNNAQAPTAILTLGILCCRARRFPRAIELLDQCIAAHPSTQTYAWQAEAYAGEGLQESAIDAFRQSINCSRTSP